MKKDQSKRDDNAGKASSNSAKKNAASYNRTSKKDSAADYPEKNKPGRGSGRFIKPNSPFLKGKDDNKPGSQEKKSHWQEKPKGKIRQGKTSHHIDTFEGKDAAESNQKLSKALERERKATDRGEGTPPTRRNDRNSSGNDSSQRENKKDDKKAGRFAVNKGKNYVPKPEYDLKRINDISTKKNPEKASSDLIRLNKYISNAGICSRRDADLLIKAGEIKVNGQPVTEMGYKVKRTDEIKYGDKILSREKPVYVLLNKPKDFITTTSDPEDRKTIMNLVANACEERIYPVGRLDRHTTGLILLTNDGELALKLAHPSNEVKKLYQVDIDKPITDEDLIKVQEGVQLEDGIATVDEVAIVTPDRKSLGLQIHIGRNRIVRRIFEHLGYEVVKLDRVMYAGLDKKDLPRGKWRFLSEKEVIRLKYMN